MIACDFYKGTDKNRGFGVRVFLVGQYSLLNCNLNPKFRQDTAKVSTVFCLNIDKNYKP